MDPAKCEGCIYRADCECHLFRHGLCHHTGSSEFLKHFSSYATQWVSSTTLLIIKENVFCTMTGYSGAVTGKRGDLNMFAALRRLKEQQKFKYGIDGGFTSPSVHHVRCKCLHLTWLSSLLHSVDRQRQSRA